VILGRSPALWLALVAALLNAAVVVFHIPLDGIQVAALNGLAVAAIGVIANAADPTTAATFAFTTKAPNLTILRSSSPTESFTGDETGSAASPVATTTIPTDASADDGGKDWIGR
jgi:hypothetical protein